MPKTKEFSVRLDDEPGTLAELCSVLADGKVNIVAFQAIPMEGDSLFRFIVDNPTKAKSILETNKFKPKEKDVVQVKLPNTPGQLARVASQLAEAEININYTYCGNEAGTNEPFLIFGVDDVPRSVKLLDKALATAAGA